MKTAANVSTSAPVALPTGIDEKVSPFIAACLAPLPAGEKPVDTPAFRRLLEHDKFVAWDAARQLVTYFEALHTAAAICSLRAHADSAAQMACYEAWQHACAAKRALCLVPAPTAKEWKYKVRHLASVADDAGKRQIKADQQRFAAETAA